MDAIINIDVKGVDELIAYADRLKGLLEEVKEVVDQINTASITLDLRNP